MIRALFMALIVPVVSFGQAITGVSGTIGHGESITISGTGFTVSDDSQPLYIDTVEAGSFSGSWSSTGTLTVDSVSRHGNSTYAGYLDFVGDPVGGFDSNNLGYFTAASSPLSERWYVSYWFYLDSNFDWGESTYGGGDENLSNVKFLRFWNPGSVDENYLINLHGYSDSAVWYISPDHTEINTGLNGFMTSWTKGAWHHVQFEYGENSSLGATDGVFRMWFDGAMVINDTNEATRESDPELKRPQIIGFYDAHNDSGTDSDDFWIDDVVADTTWARVELGDASVYSNCTHREYQPTTSRTATSITVTLNQGSFANAASAYLFVVNADGTASSGYPVEIGGSGGSSTPDIQSATRSGGNAELTWLSGDGGPYMVWLQASGQDVRAIATTDTTATLPMSSAATDVTVKDGTSQRRAHIAE